MELKKLDVPTTSITEVKKSPMDVFNQAREAGTAVYVFNREKVAGVMLTQEQYETLLQELDYLRQRPLMEEEPEQPPVAGLEEFLQIMRQALITGASISAILAIRLILPYTTIPRITQQMAPTRILFTDNASSKTVTSELI